MSWLIAFASPSGWGIAVEGSAPMLAGDAVVGNGHELDVTPVAAATGGRAGGELEVCRVTAGELDAFGVRLQAPGADVASVRILSACFSAEHAAALVAVRPTGAKGQDRDAVMAASLGEREGVSVFDPRLSTTYAADGTPRQVGMELWLGETEEGEQYPHRVAGEAAGESFEVDQTGLRISAHGLRCHSRGEHGTGVYVLVRRH